MGLFKNKACLRLVAACLSTGILTATASDSAMSREPWGKRFARTYSIYQSSGSEQFIDAYERELEIRLDDGDRKFLTKSLAGPIRDEKIKFPSFSVYADRVRVEAPGVRIYDIGSKTNGDEKVTWFVNGHPLAIGEGDNLRTIQAQLVKIAGDTNALSRARSPAYLRWLDELLPSAHADAGTVAIILVALAVVAAVIYFAYKATKAVTKGVADVAKGAKQSTKQAIDKVSDAAAGTLTHVGDSAATAIDKNAGAAQGLIDATTQKVEQLPPVPAK